MIASLGMYDRAETATANDAYWSAIRAQLGEGPAHLERETNEFDIWTDPKLVLSQTCGMPYRTLLYDRVKIIGTPVYDLPGLIPGYYQSVLVARQGDTTHLLDFQDRVLAYNDPVSQSGWAAPQNHAAKVGFQFTKLFCSGSHIASANAVAHKRADIAALDIVTWKLICAFDEIARDLTVIDTTPQTPGLPYITSPSHDTGRLYQAIENAITLLEDETRKILMLKGITYIDPAAYRAVKNPAPPMIPKH